MKKILSSIAFAAFAAVAYAEPVNVLSLGVKNDGSEDVSSIVNEATAKGVLFFPAGVYKVAHPLRLKNRIRGEGYARMPNVNGERTWFVSAISCSNLQAGVIEFGGKVQINLEEINIKCHSEECGIRIEGCEQLTSTFISKVGIYNLRGTGLCVNGCGSRPIFAQDMTVFGASDHPLHSVGISTSSGVVDCRLSNIEIMYWEDGSIKGAPDHNGAFYHCESGSSGRLVINGGLVGVGGTDANPGWMRDVYITGQTVRDVILKSEYAIKPENLSRLCIGTVPPDYTLRYADKGHCKVADVFTVAKTGACEGILTLEDGAARYREVLAL